jgi:glycosyltransferase involved in cell wall biosynthesis
MSSKKIVFLFTDSFPFGYNETYTLAEMNVTQGEYEKIYFFPLNCKNEGANRFTAENAKMIDIHTLYTDKSTSYFWMISIWLYELFNTTHKSKYFKKFAILKLYNALFYAGRIKRFIKEEGLNPDDIIFYSYWNYHWSLVCAVLKKDYPNSVALTRAHLHDLYDSLSFNYFANFKYNKLDRVICISKHGLDYLKENYKKYSHKFSLSYLGAMPQSQELNKEDYSGKFVIASCSSVRPEKRVDTIVDILKHVDVPLVWHHFGGGRDMETLKKKALGLPKNIEVVLHGSVSNTFILDSYKKLPINLFLNVSYEEGLPFSLMEIISFGVPILACDIYGNKEICTNETGILIPKEFDSEAVAKQIKNFLLQPSIKKEGILAFWNKNFNAENNFKALANEIKN